ncbi:MAG: AMP-binding protein, partial [Muribaculaceae bacterium]|nr:AMP-binding protein [Muribaculaceae bacterium]
MPVFVVPCVFALDDSVDLQRMKAAVETVVEAYPVMGMCFSQYDDGTPCFEDCREKVVASVENLTTAQWEELISAPPKVFDFDGGPLFVARIVRTPEGKWLYICFHHSICDGSSVRIIVRDIAKAYNGESVENQGLTPAEAFAQEQERQKSAAHDEAVAWYKDVFLGIDVDSTPLPDVLEDNSTNTAPLFSTVRRKKRTLVVEHPAAFARSRELGVPMSILFDGAFGYMIGIWNATSESLFCTIHNGRVTDAEKQSVLMLVRTIPIYCQWDADTTVADYLKKLAEQNAKALRYARECPYAEVCALTGIAPQLNFSYRGSVQVGNFIAEGVITSGDRIGFQTNGESLLFLLDHVNGKLEVKVEYQSAQYTEAFIDSMLEAYSAVLKGFMECERLADIQFCSPEMEEKLEAVNKAETGIGDGETIVDRFRHFAHATPDKIALKTDDIALTFKQVENTAERLAAHINSLGIGSGDVVSVLIGRNEYMLTATLGVLFSGAAYEPLDSTYPAERLNYMMSDAGVSLLIKDRDVDIELDADLKDKVHVLYTDEIASLEAKQLQHPEKAKVTLDSPFIILYTSGTTGTPKGTRLTH